MIKKRLLILLRERRLFDVVPEFARFEERDLRGGLDALTVTVHLVKARNTCGAMPMSRNIAAYECRASLLASAVGANPCCCPRLHVSVHVVGIRTTCQPIPPSRHIAVHESRASVLPRAVGADPGHHPGRYLPPRNPSDGVGDGRAALGGNGPTGDGATAARLAHLVAAALERPPTSAGQTPPA
jgi:hypothetical protein